MDASSAVSLGLILLLKRLLAFVIDWIILFTIFALLQFAIAMDRWVLSFDLCYGRLSGCYRGRWRTS